MKYKKYALTESKDYPAKILTSINDMDPRNMSLHWHKEIELIYVLKGTFRIHTLSKDIIMNENQLYFLNSEEIHSYYGDTTHTDFVVLNVPPRVIIQYLNDPTKEIFFKLNNVNAIEEIKKSMQTLFDCNNDKTRYGVLHKKAMLNNILYHLIKECMVESFEYIRGSHSENYGCAQSAIRYMNTYYKKEITLTEISTYVGMTSAHFSKYFKDKTELTFTQYLRRIRLEHAVYDMIHDDLSVNNASQNNGFPNVNAFISACKAEYGRTPKEVKVYGKA